MEEQPSTLSGFTTQKARPLPVILLADVSGSMSANGKIDALNASIADMLDVFAGEEQVRAEIYTAIITFGAEAQIHVPLQAASEVEWEPLSASGRTPMGQAFALAADLIHDKEQIPSRAYRPTLVALSDGIPTDDWRSGLEKLSEGRAAKVDRLALAIGGDADEDMLRTFLDDPEKQVFRAEDARRIHEFFRFVTMSVTERSKSADPNQIPEMDDPFADDDY